MKIWLCILSFVVVIQWIKIYSLQDEIERIKSWYPFVELCKMKMTEKFYGKNYKTKFKNTKFTLKEDENKKENKDDGETNRT